MATGAALVAVFYALSAMLMPFVVAVVLAYICDPLVRRLCACKMPRALAVLLVVLALGATLLLTIGIIVPMVYHEALALIARLPDWVDAINTRLLPWLGQWLGVENAVQLDMDSIKQWLVRYRSQATNIASLLLTSAQQGGLAAIGVLANLVLIPVVMFYVLQQWPQLLDSVEVMIPRPLLPRTRRIASEIHTVLSEFLRGQLSVMLLLATYYSFGLWLAGVQFALPLGAITGLLSFIPFIGFGGGLLLALLVAAMQGAGLPPIIGVAVVYGIGQVLESYVLTPLLVGERIGLHPLAVIFALMAFGEVFGFVGMLIALPVSAALLVGLREIRSAWLASPIYRGNDTADPLPAALPEQVDEPSCNN